MSTTPNRLEIQRHAQDYWQIVRNRLGLIFLTFLLVFSVAAIITYIMPRKYVGRVEMVIERVQSDARVIGHMGDALAVSSDSFLKTQFEILSKRKTLDRVVDKLDLVARWNAPNKAAAAGKLMGNLEPQSSMKSDFITLEYFDEDAKLAADIANSIAESYKETRLALDNERTDKALAQITARSPRRKSRPRRRSPRCSTSRSVSASWRCRAPWAAPPTRMMSPPRRAPLWWTRSRTSAGSSVRSAI